MLLSLFLTLAALTTLCNGHGYLSTPASRNYMRDALNAGAPYECPYTAAEGGCTLPDQDYDKQSGAAGGPGVVHATCNYGDSSCQPSHGMCGDKWNDVQNHVEGGRFSSGRVNGIYEPGQIIYLTMTITAHHYGFHEFTLYDVSDSATATTVTSPSTTSYKLQRYNPDLTHTQCKYWTIDPATQYCMPPPFGGDGNYLGVNPYTHAWTLPAGVTCKRCVLQWHWVTANSPGANPEEFWNCVDITIRSTGPYINAGTGVEDPDSGNAPGGTPSPNNNPAPTRPPTNQYGSGCVAVPGKGTTDEWCQSVNCDPVYIEGGYCTVAGTTVAGSSTTTTTTTTTAAPTTGGSSSSTTTTTTTTTAAPGSPCYAIPGKGVTDGWCQAANCDPAYSEYCTRNPGATTGPQCRAVPGSGVTDAWCRAVNCDPAYSGYCVSA